MPTHRISADAGAFITRAKKAGKSNRVIADELEAKHGVKLDQRTIGRYATRTQNQPAPKQARLAPKHSRPHTKFVDERFESAPIVDTTLDEVEALERRAKRLQELLGDDANLPIRDTAALNAELRQTFASIRKARAAKQEQVDVLSADAKAVLDRIRKFQTQNKTYPIQQQPQAEEPKPEDVPVPAATGTDPR